jgi:hypothetical protein
MKSNSNKVLEQSYQELMEHEFSELSEIIIYGEKINLLSIDINNFNPTNRLDSLYKKLSKRCNKIMNYNEIIKTCQLDKIQPSIKDELLVHSLIVSFKIGAMIIKIDYVLKSHSEESNRFKMMCLTKICSFKREIERKKVKHYSDELFVELTNLFNEFIDFIVKNEE